MMGKTVLLDCTLRDGGLALKDANSQRFLFNKEQQEKLAQSLIDGGIEIIELGSVFYENVMPQYSIFSDLREISKYFGTVNKGSSFLAVFFHGPDIPIEMIPEKTQTCIDLIRLSIRYSELEKSLLYAQKLTQKGYKVSLQPIVTIRYSYSELANIVSAANEMKAFSVYFVDSYGSMYPDDITEYFNVIDSGLDEGIKIGFHAHNNLEMAMSNIVSFLQIQTRRSKIVDACCCGMGQGSGNAKTEMVASFLNRYGEERYGLERILDACEFVSSYFEHSFSCYSVPAAISAWRGIAYKYGIEARKNYDISFGEVLRFVSSIQKQQGYRFTYENLEDLYREFRG